jgi:hypothetical protein
MLNEAAGTERMPGKSMGISFGQPFKREGFALAKVGKALLKRNILSFFHNNIL